MTIQSNFWCVILLADLLISWLLKVCQKYTDRLYFGLIIAISLDDMPRLVEELSKLKDIGKRVEVGQDTVPSS